MSRETTESGLPEHLRRVEEFAVEEFRCVLREHLPKVEAGVKSTAKNASLGMTLTVRLRKDGDFDLIPSGRCNVPFNGNVGKARVEKGQLTLL